MWRKILCFFDRSAKSEREKNECSVLTPNLTEKARKKRGPYKKRKRVSAKGAKREEKTRAKRDEKREMIEKAFECIDSAAA